MGLPSVPFTAPSQSPLPVGFKPDWKPNWGMRASFTSLREIGLDDTVTARTAKGTMLDKNFIAVASKNQVSVEEGRVSKLRENALRE